MLGEGIAAGLRAIGRKPRVLGYVERDAYAASVLLARNFKLDSHLSRLLAEPESLRRTA